MLHPAAAQAIVQEIQNIQILHLLPVGNGKGVKQINVYIICLKFLELLVKIKIKVLLFFNSP